jgi:hypothetical protein
VPGVRVVSAPGSGDDAIVDLVRAQPTRPPVRGDHRRPRPPPPRDGPGRHRPRPPRGPPTRLAQPRSHQGRPTR